MAAAIWRQAPDLEPANSAGDSPVIGMIAFGRWKVLAPAVDRTITLTTRRIMVAGAGGCPKVLDHTGHRGELGEHLACQRRIDESASFQETGRARCGPRRCEESCRIGFHLMRLNLPDRSADAGDHLLDSLPRLWVCVRPHQATRSSMHGAPHIHPLPTRNLDRRSSARAAQATYALEALVARGSWPRPPGRKAHMAGRLAGTHRDFPVFQGLRAGDRSHSDGAAPNRTLNSRANLNFDQSGQNRQSLPSSPKTRTGSPLAALAGDP